MDGLSQVNPSLSPLPRGGPPDGGLCCLGQSRVGGWGSYSLGHPVWEAAGPLWDPAEALFTTLSAPHHGPSPALWQPCSPCPKGVATKALPAHCLCRQTSAQHAPQWLQPSYCPLGHWEAGRKAHPRPPPRHLHPPFVSVITQRPPVGHSLWNTPPHAQQTHGQLSQESPLIRPIDVPNLHSYTGESDVTGAGYFLPGRGAGI